jgi:hypothetical protein
MVLIIIKGRLRRIAYMNGLQVCVTEKALKVRQRRLA